MAAPPLLPPHRTKFITDRGIKRHASWGKETFSHLVAGQFGDPPTIMKLYFGGVCVFFVGFGGLKIATHGYNLHSKTSFSIEQLTELPLFYSVYLALGEFY